MSEDKLIVKRLGCSMSEDRDRIIDEIFMSLEKLTTYKHFDMKGSYIKIEDAKKVYKELRSKKDGQFISDVEFIVDSVSSQPDHSELIAEIDGRVNRTASYLHSRVLEPKDFDLLAKIKKALNI